MKQYYYTMPDAMIRAFFGKKTIIFAIDIVITVSTFAFLFKVHKDKICLH
mgnify:FL=1|jgi:hypothetical protein